MKKVINFFHNNLYLLNTGYCLYLLFMTDFSESTKYANALVYLITTLYFVVRDYNKAYREGYKEAEKICNQKMEKKHEQFKNRLWSADN